jgi:acetolactate decarboxylase
MRLVILLLLLPFSTFAQVKVAGEMRKIMQRADLSASISLDTMNRSGLYGLGVVEGLKGEIIILDGKCYVSSIREDETKTTKTFNIKAAMLVYQNVKAWSTTKIDRPVQTLADLERYLEDVRKKNGKSTDTPFAFQIKSVRGNINYHVINWKAGADHTMANHKQFAKTGELQGEGVTILGFYSNRHQGVFTHHGTKIHLHVLSNSSEVVGHIDNLSLTTFELFLSD